MGMPAAKHPRTGRMDEPTMMRDPSDAPRMPEMPHQQNMRMPAMGMDMPHMMWWAGLGVMTMIGLLEWPVMLAVGAGEMLAEQMSKRWAQMDHMP